MTKKWLDRLGACASALCAVHCLLVGVALGLMSTLGLGFLANPSTDYTFIGIAIFFGVWAVIHGIRRHHSYLPASFFLFGIIALVGTHLDRMSHRGEVHEHGVWQTVFSVLGGLSFVTFHLLNLRMQHLHEEGKCGCCNSGEAKTPTPVTLEVNRR
jgi:MerC mercury resistance protein